MIAVCIPSRTEDYLQTLLASMERSEPGSTGYVTVADNGGLAAKMGPRWPHVRFIEYEGPFIFARAINLCVAHAPSDAHILVMNDDTEVLEPSLWLTRLDMEVAREAALPYGMLSLEIAGGVGNPEQQVARAPYGTIRDARQVLCFVASLIRRAAWDKVGPLDERFVGYGFDDNDYCHRLKLAKWKLGIVSGIIVRHGKPGFVHSASYARYHTHEQWETLSAENRRRLMEKWPDQGGGPPAPPPRRRCLNLGAGDRVRYSTDQEEWRNLDLRAGPGIDTIRDIARGLPYADETFDYIYADNVLEHLELPDAIFCLNEIDRILKLGGEAHIIVPHAFSQGAYQDPSHRSQWVPRSALYWNQKQTPHGGLKVGITANLVSTREPEVTGDLATEAFITFRVRKEPL